MAKLIETDDGSHSLESTEFGVAYHSRHGALQETQIVFLDAGLHYAAKNSKTIRVLGIGFGTGLNSFMTSIEATKYNYQVDYTGVEAFPIDLQLAGQLNYPEKLDLAGLRPQFLQLHQIGEIPQMVNPNFRFQRRICQFQELDYEDTFDLIYYDAFAPEAQPELWQQPILESMFKALRKGGVLVTYCAKGVFKRTLKAVGFQVEALPGPKGKREMTRGVKL